MSATTRTRRPAQGPLRGAAGWARVRGRHLGSVAFFTNRVTGLLLIGYMYLHLGVLYLLTQGPGSWARVLDLFKNHYFLALESLLILCILVHGLNGLRLALVGTGVGVRHQKAWFVAAVCMSAVLYVVAVLAMFVVIPRLWGDVRWPPTSEKRSKSVSHLRRTEGAAGPRRGSSRPPPESC